MTNRANVTGSTPNSTKGMNVPAGATPGSTKNTVNTLVFTPDETVAARYVAIGDKGDVYTITYGPVTNYTVHINGHMYRFGIRTMGDAVQYAVNIWERRKLG